MFDISMGEVIILGGAGIMLLGKNDMPLVFRLVGRMVGKVSGLVQGGRARMAELSKGSDLLQLQNEIRTNLDDLRTIKSEIAGAARMPPSITSTAHPGSQALKQQLSPSFAPPDAHGVPGDAASRNKPSDVAGSLGLPHMGVPAPVDGASRAPAGAPEFVAGFGGNALGRRTVPGNELGEGHALADARAGAGVGSVRSAGGDRLQQLAIMETKFAEQGLYSHKTESIAGGADILNASITESLIQERFNKTFADMMAGDGSTPPPESIVAASDISPSDVNSESTSSDDKEKNDPPPKS